MVTNHSRPGIWSRCPWAVGLSWCCWWSNPNHSPCNDGAGEGGLGAWDATYSNMSSDNDTILMILWWFQPVEHGKLAIQVIGCRILLFLDFPGSKDAFRVNKSLEPTRWHVQIILVNPAVFTKAHESFFKVWRPGFRLAPKQGHNKAKCLFNGKIWIWYAALISRPYHTLMAAWNLVLSTVILEWTKHI